MRDGKQLLLASRPFAREHRLTSWWCLLSTIGIFAALQTVIVLAASTPLRIVASVLAGFLLVRLFILYHDFAHGTIFRKSPLAWAIMSFYGLAVLSPPSIWKRSHDHHHRHNSKASGTGIGSFPIMTVREYHRASRGQRWAHLIVRHPLTFLFGYVTVFLYGMCLRSLRVNPRAHADSALAIVVHGSIAAGLAMVGLDVLVLCLIVPGVISGMVGSYLFYAQHNFPEARIQESEEWNYVTAALESSSYLRTGRIMAWLTGNIGYHHVHHLNHHIPFYRLPEAMRGLPELQSPGSTTLSLADIRACLRLKLWDDDMQKLVPLPR